MPNSYDIRLSPILFLWMKRTCCGVEYRLSECMNQLNVCSLYVHCTFKTLHNFFFLLRTNSDKPKTEKNMSNEREKHENTNQNIILFFSLSVYVEGSVLSALVMSIQHSNACRRVQRVCGKNILKWECVQSLITRYVYACVYYYVPVCHGIDPRANLRSYRHVIFIYNLKRHWRWYDFLPSYFYLYLANIFS